MDAEQIRREMSLTRASIDRKLDLLAARTSEMKREAWHGTRVLLMASAAVVSGVLWRRSRRRRAIRKRRLLRESVHL